MDGVAPLDSYRVWHISQRNGRWVCLSGWFTEHESAEQTATDLRVFMSAYGEPLKNVCVLQEGEVPWSLVPSPKGRLSDLAERSLVADRQR